MLHRCSADSGLMGSVECAPAARDAAADVLRVGGVEARLADGAALALKLAGAERVRPVEELRQILDRVTVEVVNGLLDAEFFDLV